LAKQASAGDDVYFTVPGIATVRWDEPQTTVCVEWDGWANAAEFKSLLDAEVKALRDHKGTRLLADCRRQRVLNLADQERANREWLPEVVAAGLKRFAIVLPESETAAGHLRERLSSVTEMEVAYFATVEEARDWLGR
jgi:stage II sporulation SpoAA-like protein